MGIVRHADAGYDRAIENAKRFAVNVPMCPELQFAGPRL
ncbi:MAG: hypothetical protein ABSF91_12530 [Bacteroidota bacterium]